MRVASLCVLLLLYCMPGLTYSLPDISSFFSSLLSKQNGDDVTKEEAEEVRERTKRQSNIGDSSPETHMASTSVLPTNPDGTINLRYMPTLANGHIGFTPYSESLFVNGLYNGVGGESHRVEIPAFIMGKIKLGTPQQERQWRVNRKYSLNAETGVFTEEITSDYIYVEHRMYVHQKYNRLLVSDIYAKARQHFQGQGGVLTLDYPIASSEFEQTLVTKDLNNFRPAKYEADWQFEGTTKTAEFGATPQKISVFWMTPEPTISVRSVRESKNVTMIMAIDHLKANAQDEFKVGLRILFRDTDGGPMKLLREHEEAWRATWRRGKLELEGDDLVVKKLAMFSQYYLLSNMPAYEPYLKPQKTDFLYGVGRQSLGKGKKDENQQGHVFWDSEVYVLPAILPMHPEMAKHILRYRSAHREVAENIAKAEGGKGARYPWESAYSGNDVTPEGTCDGCRERQIHVGASIAFAIRQYFSLTRDRDYLTSPEYEGCDVMKGIADYYADLAKFNPEDGRYHIKDVMGPDDFHDHQTNDVYTQASISLAIHYARYMACMCGRPERDEIPDEYIQKALYLKLPFDNIKKIHFQSEEFEKDENKTVKQASVVLLGYPLNWNMSLDIQKNDLEYYEQLMDANTPAMTKSFMTVGWKFINDHAKTMSFFRTSYEDYIVQPFKVWMEYNEQSLNDGDKSTVNFLPGMGGFLQSIIYGFVGLRIRPEMIEFHNPLPPEGIFVIRMRGFYYLEANMTITVNRSPREVLIEVHEVGQYPLVLVRNNSDGGRAPEESLNPGPVVRVENPELGFYIYSTLGTACDHPRDYIYMPWGYSPFINSAPGLGSTFNLLYYLGSVWMLLWYYER